MPYDTVTRENIDIMVHEFYARVLKDEMVGPYFTKALGEDINSPKWFEHFSTLISFWVLMMIGAPGYGGNPFPPHAFLGQLYPETFERWLVLFRETLDEYYVPQIADKFYKKAEILAETFIENLGLNDEDDD